MKCNSANVSLCISLSILLSSIIFGILYLIYIDMGSQNNKFGEISLYLFAVSFLACIIRSSIKEEDTKSNPVKVSPGELTFSA
jgi:hypothetical protein